VKDSRAINTTEASEIVHQRVGDTKHQDIGASDMLWNLKKECNVCQDRQKQQHFGFYGAAIVWKITLF
jgi:hypothetical protein